MFQKKIISDQVRKYSISPDLHDPFQCYKKLLPSANIICPKQMSLFHKLQTNVTFSQASDKCHCFTSFRQMSLFHELQTNVTVSRASDKCHCFTSFRQMSLFHELQTNVTVSRASDKCHCFTSFRQMSLFYETKHLPGHIRKLTIAYST